MSESGYGRVLLKISGESLQGSEPAGAGIDPVSLNYVSQQIGEALSLGIELAVVIGGGNIWRGEEAARQGMDRASADYAECSPPSSMPLSSRMPSRREGL